MRIPYLTIGILLCLLPWVAHAITLKQAMTMAETTHPELGMSALDNDVARAHLTSQSAYTYNPELSLEYQDRQLNGGGNSVDYYIGISQAIELGGKRGYREEAAQAALQGSQKATDGLRQKLMTDAAKAYVKLFIAKKSLDIRNQQTQSLKVLSLAVKRQLDVGDANILDANLAQSAYATALSAETETRQSYALIQMQYIAAVGGDDAGDLDTHLPRLNVAWPLPEQPLNIAKTSRADLAVLQAQVRQSKAQAELADAIRVSDPTLSLMKGREAGEDLLKVGISFALPLSDSRKGAYQAYLAQAMRSESAMHWFERRLALEVQAAVENHHFAIQALQDAHDMQQRMDTSNSVILAKAAFQAGELSLEDLVVHINQALEARLTTLNIMQQGWFARIRLAEVLGRPEYILQGIQK